MKLSLKIYIGFYVFMMGLIILTMIILFSVGLFGWAILCLVMSFFYIESICESISNSIERQKRR